MSLLTIKETLAVPSIPGLPVLVTSKFFPSLNLPTYLLLKLASWYKLNSNDEYDVFCTVCDSEESVRLKVTVESLYKLSGGLIGLIVPPVEVLQKDLPTMTSTMLQLLERIPSNLQTVMKIL